MGLFDEAEVSHYSTSQGGSSTKEEVKCSIVSQFTGKNQRVIKSLGTSVKAVLLT
jgi:hypothetical protein